MKKRNPTATEHQEQSAVIAWWASYCRTKGIDERLLFAIPNAQKFMSKARNMHAAYAHAVKEGLREGVPDLMLAWPKPIDQSSNPYASYDRIFFGLFIELKRKGAKPKKPQLEFADLLRRQGYNVVIAQGADEAIRAIKGYIET